jgi:hypothetical protein
MRGINSLFLLGTLRGEPEQLTSKAGKNYIRFEMDVTTVRRTNGMDEEVREVIPVTAFSKLGEIVTKFVKADGSPVKDLNDFLRADHRRSGCPIEVVTGAFDFALERRVTK